MRVTRPEEPRIGAEKRAEERGVSLSDYWYLWSLGISHAPKSATAREWYEFANDWVTSLTLEEIENALLIEELKITVKKR